MLTLTERGSDLLSQQMDVNKGLKLQIEHLKFASKKLAEAIAESEVVTETVEVEKLVEKEVFVTPKEITEKLISQNGTITTLTESLTDANKKANQLEKTVEELTVKLEDEIDNAFGDSSALEKELLEVQEKSVSEIEKLNSKVLNSKQLLTEKISEIDKLKKSLKISEEVVHETSVKHLAASYRVEKSVVEEALSKFTDEERVVEFIKKSSKRLRKNAPIIEEAPEYTPNRKSSKKKAYLETLTQG